MRLASYSKFHELLSKIDFLRLDMAPVVMMVYQKSVEKDFMSVEGMFYQVRFTNARNYYCLITKESLE